MEASSSGFSEDLFQAAAEGKEKILLKLLEEEGADANCPDATGNTALHLAVRNGHKRAVAILLKNQAQTNLVNNEGDTALHLAVRRGNIRIVSALLHHAADTNQTNNKGLTPLHIAVDENFVNIIEKLLENNGNPNIPDKYGKTPLHLAAMEGYETAVRWLLTAGSEVGAKDEDGWTPLHWAAFGGHKMAIEMLLVAGSDAKAKNEIGETPLHLAALKGEDSSVGMLCAYGEVGAKDQDGWTPLHWAAFRGHEAVVPCLLTAGSDAGAKDKIGRTPLHLAAFRGHKAAIQFLLMAGGDLRAEDNDGWTPLQSALQNGHHETMALLAGTKVQVKVKKFEGVMNLHYAAFQGHIEHMKLMVSAGAKVNAKDGEGRTPLHAAAFRGHAEAVRLLLEAGGDVGAKDKHRITPLHCAVIEGQFEAMRLLIFAGADLSAKDDNDMTPLHLATFRCDEAAVRFLLMAGSDIGVKDEDGMTILHYAALQGHLQGIRLLTDVGAQVNAKNADGLTPLHLATKYGHVEAMRLLADSGAEVNAQCIQGLTSLHFATKNGHVEAMRLLTDSGADVNIQYSQGMAPLHIAAGYGNVEAIRLLAETGADVSAPTGTTRVTPLHSAAMNGHVDAIRLLVDIGANIHAQSIKGMTPLLCATLFFHHDAMRLLINAGASVNVQDNNGDTFLHYSSEKGHLEGMSLLTDAGAHVNAREQRGRTPLYNAAFSGHEAAVQFLLTAGSDVRQKDKEDRTPLHAAALFGNEAVVRLLLMAGSDVGAKESKEATPLHFAANGGHTEVVKMLLNSGAPVAAKDSNGWTPLHHASGNGKIEAIRLLKEVSEDMNVRDVHGRTPLHMAVLNGHPESLRLLADAGARTNVKDVDGMTLLHAAAAIGNEAAVHFLLTTGSDVGAKDNNGKTPLHWAASEDHKLVVRMLLSAGSDIEAKDKDGKTPLHTVAVAGQLESIRVLIDAGAESNTKDIEGWSPLTIASALGNLDVVDILLSQGKADPNFASAKGWRPLDCAVHYNHYDVAKRLEALGAKATSVLRPPEGGSRLRSDTETVDGISAMLDSVAEIVNLEAVHPKEKYRFSCRALTGDLILTENLLETPGAVDTSDITLLHFAALGGHDSLIEALTDAGWDVKALTRNGASVLHFASLSGRQSTVKLVAQKVDPGQVDAQGLTAEQYARARGHHHIAWWLSKGRSKPDEPISLSLNALHNLLEENREKMVFAPSNVEAAEVLLNCGVWDLHYQDERGRTPLHLAALNNRRLEVEFLLEHGALPSARTHDLKTPSDLAARQGHREVAALLSQRSGTQQISEAEKCRLSEQLLRLIVKTSQDGSEDQARRCLDAVKECTFLLESGAPLEALCCQDTHALHLAITSNCTPLLPLLLSTGVPLTACLACLGPVEVAWRSENAMPNVGVLVTRAVEQKLRMEMDFEAVTPHDKILKKVIEDLAVALRGDKPWIAKCPGFIIPGMDPLDRLLYTACARGATTAAWWIWKKGGHINSLSHKESTPLHAAIEAGHFETAFAMISHMRANPFRKDGKGHTAMDLLPDNERKKHLEDCRRKEYRILSKALMRAKDNCDKHDLMQLILFYVVLTQVHGTENKEEEFHWKSVLSLMTKFLPEEGDPLSWIQDFVTSLTERRPDLQCTPPSENTCSENTCHYSVLITVGKELYTIFERQTTMQKVDYQFDHNYGRLKAKAMRLCCEEDLPLFLHLLVTVAKVSVDDAIDTEYNVTPLHHAARYNNHSALMYLINYGARQEKEDLFGNSPKHYALMHGHKDISQVLRYQNVNCTGVASGELSKSFTHYMNLYCITTDSDGLEPHETNDVTKVIHYHLNLLGKAWKEKGIASYVEKIHIDFTKGESLVILRLIDEFIGRLMIQMKSVEPLFEGEHKILGSSADKVRLYGPDEYDVNVVLKNISGHLEGGIQVSITTEKVDNEGRLAFINLSSDKEEIHHLLQDSNLLDRFYEVMRECFPTCQIMDKRLSVMSPGLRRTQVGVELLFLWMGREFGLLYVGVDLVPTIEAPWPDQLPRPKLTSPDLRTVYINSTGRGKWRFSFAHAENMIMKTLTEEQRSVYLVCKVILSRLKAEGWAPRVIKNQYKYFNNKFFNIPSPKGFSLKNSFFLELEQFPDPNLWTQEHSFKRIISVFRRMCVEVCDPTTNEITLDSGKLRAYFGGDFEGACAGFGAPEVVRFLESLEDSDIWCKKD